MLGRFKKKTLYHCEQLAHRTVLERDANINWSIMIQRQHQLLELP